MPIYEYKCQQCHRHTEKRQKFSDPEITACPHCGGPIERVISAPAFAFAGGGWYKDLYSSNKPAPSGGDSKGESAKPDAAADNKSTASSGDSKPASGNGESKSPAPAPAAAPAASSDKK